MPQRIVRRKQHAAQHPLLGFDGMGRQPIHSRRIGERGLATASFFEVSPLAAILFFQGFDQVFSVAEARSVSNHFKIFTGYPDQAGH